MGNNNVHSLNLITHQLIFNINLKLTMSVYSLFSDTLYLKDSDNKINDIILIC